MEAFTIKNINARDDLLGELFLHYLYAVTSGERNHASIIFHFKMEDKFYKFYINKVSKKSITLVCADKKCKTAQKIILDEQFVKCEVNGLKNGDKFRNKFYIDNSDLELRNLKNWTVILHKTLPHSCTIKQTFYDHLHTSFRENHTDLALLTGRGESDTIGRSWSVKSKYGPEIEALIFRDKKLEQNSSSRKLNRLIKNDLINGVPLSAKTVGESNLHDKNNFKTDLPHH